MRLSRPTLLLVSALLSCSPLASQERPTAPARPGESSESAASASARRAAKDSAERAANRKYRIGIGASFDFLNGVSATDLYGDMTIRIPELLKVRGGTIGFDGGLYNGRATAARESRDLDRTIRLRGTADSTLVVVQRIERIEDEHTDNLTLFFAPTLRLTRNVAFALHSEVARTERVQTIATRTLSLDTTMEGARAGDDRRPTALPRDTTRTIRIPAFSSFFGAGPLINFDDEDYNLWHKPIIGFEVVDGKVRGAFAVQFRLTDYDHGFKLGGEVRGNLRFRNPSIAVFLARDFSLGKLADFLVGGDGDNDPEPADDGTNNAEPATGNGTPPPAIPPAAPPAPPTPPTPS